MRSENFEFDTVIRGGRVVDGTRLPSFVGDVAITDGRVVQTGQVSGRGRKFSYVYGPSVDFYVTFFT